MSENTDVTSLGDGRTAIKGSSSIMTITSSAIAPQAVPGSTPTKRTKENDTESGSREWAAWGDGDDWPLQMIEKKSKISVMNRALDLSGDLHFGAGIEWCEWDEDNKKDSIVYIPEWDFFTRDIKFNYNVEHGKVVNSLKHWFLGAVEFILEKNTNNVFSVKTLDTAYVRLGKRNKGKIDKVYYSMDFGSGQVDNPEMIPVFDPLKPFSKKKFVVLFSYDTFGRNYYPDPYWNSTFNNGWADIAIEVPKLIKWIYKNQISIKYHIHYPVTAIRTECKEWDELTTKERIKWLSDKQLSIEDNLIGGENAGKSVISTFETKDDLVEIKPISNLIDNKGDLPNNVAANSEILFSIGLDPALVGLNMPGGKDLNGSGGADKKEGMKISQATLFLERSITLYLPRLIGFFNGFDPKYYPKYKDIDVSMTTTEKKQEEKQTNKDKCHTLLILKLILSPL